MTPLGPLGFWGAEEKRKAENRVKREERLWRSLPILISVAALLVAVFK